MANPESDNYVTRNVYIIRVNDFVRIEAFEDISEAVKFVINAVIPRLRDHHLFRSIGSPKIPSWSNGRDTCITIQTLVLQ